MNSFKNSEEGITLVEVMVVVLIVALLSLILIVDFPKIRLQFALSRAAYRFSQDLRKVEDMGFSGEAQAEEAQGYGVYLDLSQSQTQYIIYADENGNNIYDPGGAEPDNIIQTVDLAMQEAGIIIKEMKHLENPSDPKVSINFTPPNPTVDISNIDSAYYNHIKVVFAILTDQEKQRGVNVYKSGLIETE